MESVQMIRQPAFDDSHIRPSSLSNRPSYRRSRKPMPDPVEGSVKIESVVLEPLYDLKSRFLEMSNSTTAANLNPRTARLREQGPQQVQPVALPPVPVLDRFAKRGERNTDHSIAQHPTAHPTKWQASTYFPRTAIPRHHDLIDHVREAELQHSPPRR
jgi:hypothetical protein